MASSISNGKHRKNSLSAQYKYRQPSKDTQVQNASHFTEKKIQWGTLEAVLSCNHARSRRIFNSIFLNHLHSILGHYNCLHYLPDGYVPLLS